MIDTIPWHAVQSGAPEGEAVEWVKDELMKLSKEEAIDMLLAILEAQNLPDDFMGENRVMHEFKNL